MTFDVSRPSPIHFSTKDTLRVSCRSLSCLEDPDIEDSVKVLFRRQVYSNSSTGLEKSAQGVWNTPPYPIFGDQLVLLMTSWESESIRITLSDLDPQQVARRSTGHFHPCFRARRSVSSPVFASKFSTRLSVWKEGP